MRQPLANASDPAVAVLASAIRGQRWGRVSALYGMLLHHPPVAEGWAGLGSAIRRRTGLDDRTRELAICLVAAVCEQPFEWANHAPLATAAGVSSAELDALLDRAACPTLSPNERVLLDLVEEVARGRVADQTFRRASTTFEPTALVEIVATAAYYVGTARFLDAFGIDEDAPDLLGADPEVGS